jgi:hypothetical protein
MLGRWIVFGALASYALVVGCVMLSGNGSSSAGGTSAGHYHSTTVPAGLPYRGIAMQIQRVDWIDQYEKSIDEVADTGADTVLLVLDARQENGASSHIYLDMRMTPTPDQLGALIDHAKKRKLRVVLMPIVLLDNPRNTEWRGNIKPDGGWSSWFDSYRDMMTQFSWIAQGHGVDVLVVGSELVSTETEVDQWTKTIATIRENFHGNLTYSANWDHYTSLPFWDQLDLIGMNSYYKLGENKDVTEPEIESRWRDIQKNIIGFSEKKGKPILFLEAGWCSLENSASEPWDYTQQDLPADNDLQKRLYDAFFNVWYGNPHLGGFMMWEWPPGPAEEKGYSPKGKPAEAVLREWMAKKPWTVQ